MSAPAPAPGATHHVVHEPAPFLVFVLANTGILRSLCLFNGVGTVTGHVWRGERISEFLVCPAGTTYERRVPAEFVYLPAEAPDVITFFRPRAARSEGRP